MADRLLSSITARRSGQAMSNSSSLAVPVYFLDARCVCHDLKHGGKVTLLETFCIKVGIKMATLVTCSQTVSVMWSSSPDGSPWSACSSCHTSAAQYAPDAPVTCTCLVPDSGEREREREREAEGGRSRHNGEETPTLAQRERNKERD